jgi:hypothetical protein
MVLTEADTVALAAIIRNAIRDRYNIVDPVLLARASDSSLRAVIVEAINGFLTAHSGLKGT